MVQPRRQVASTPSHAQTTQLQEGKPPLHVVLVADDDQRLAAWRLAIETGTPPWRVEIFRAYGEAMLRSTHLGPHCLVMDAEEDSVLGAAVRRFLSRSAPHAHAVWVGDPSAGGALPSLAEVHALQRQLAEIARHRLCPVH